MRLGDLELTVTVDDEPLEEFGLKTVEIQGRMQATCFIASEAGKSFEMCGYNGTGDIMAYDLFMDGRAATESIVEAESDFLNVGLREDSETLRPFIFGSLTTTDDDAFLNDPRICLADIGTIRVDFYRSIINEKSDRHKGDEAIDIPAIHERSKKAGGHCVQFGAPIQCETSSVNIDFIDQYPECPHARFIFTYRSQEMLQAQGIAPAQEPVPESDQSQPSPNEAGPSVAGSKRRNDADANGRNVKVKTEHNPDLPLAELLAEQVALEARIRAARERELEVKREPSPIALGPLNGEVIDLTIDD